MYVVRVDIWIYVCNISDVPSIDTCMFEFVCLCILVYVCVCVCMCVYVCVCTEDKNKIHV